MFTPEDLRRAEESGDLNMNTNILDLRPDPVHFVKYLKSLERTDISADIYMRLLDAYRESKADTDANPLRSVHISILRAVD